MLILFPLPSPSPTERALRGEWSGDGKVRRGTEAGKNRTRRKQGDPIQGLSSRSPLSHLRILASSHHMPLSERHEVSERHVMTGTTRERSIIARLTASMSLLASLLPSSYRYRPEGEARREASEARRQARDERNEMRDRRLAREPGGGAVTHSLLSSFLTLRASPRRSLTLTAWPAARRSDK